MPSATRNTKAYSGVAGSDPGKSKTWLNTSADTPRVAANEMTLAATRITGATSERNSSISTRKTTARIAGMMTRRSRSLDCRTSKLTAVLPPTRTSGPTVSRVARSFSTTAWAAELSAAGVKVAWTRTLPSTTFGGTPGACPTNAEATPSTDFTSASTFSALAWGAMICTGDPEPAGKCFARTSWPVTESTLLRKICDWVTPPALRVGANVAQASSPTSVNTQVRRG